MAKVKKAPARPPAAGPDDLTRRKLEDLREDCRRHREHPVRLFIRAGPSDGVLVNPWRGEMHLATSPKPIRWSALIGGKLEAHAALESEEAMAQARAQALLERLGKLRWRVPLLASEDGWRDRATWMEGAMILLEREGSSVRVPLAEPVVNKRANDTAIIVVDPEPSVKLHELEVPDVVAAIAEVCDAILGAGSGAVEASPTRRRPKLELLQEALLALARFRNAGKTPSDAEIAKSICVAPSTFSEQVAKSPIWKRARATQVRKPGPESQDAEAVDRSETEEPNAKPNLEPAIVRRKARG